MNGVHDGAAAPALLVSEHSTAAPQPDVQLQHDDLICPVCRSLLRDPFVTACGHSFCYPCVSQHLAHRKNCPSCAAYLTFDLVYPNFLLQQLAAKVKVADRRRRASTAERIHQLLRDADAAAEADASGGAKGGGLSEADLEGLLSALYARKQALQQRSAQDNLQLLLHFLTYSRSLSPRFLIYTRRHAPILDSRLPMLPGRWHSVSFKGVSPFLASDVQRSKAAEARGAQPAAARAGERH
jgi:Zinc finger, C3HC4 type (RING finger)